MIFVHLCRVIFKSITAHQLSNLLLSLGNTLLFMLLLALHLVLGTVIMYFLCNSLKCAFGTHMLSHVYIDTYVSTYIGC